MRLRFHDDVGDFVATAGAVYGRDPVRHTVELTLLRGGALPGDRAPLLLTAWDGADLAGAAMQTPPFPLLCSGLRLPIVADVVAELVSAGTVLTGVRGPRETAETFSKEWQAATGASAHVDTEERLYRLDSLRAPAQVPGSPRRAGADDSAVLIEFQCGFAAEAFGHEPDPDKAREAMAAAEAAGDVYVLWSVDGTLVSMAGVRSPAAGVSRIGPVYTPPVHRGHGYGSAVTAAGCRWASAAGADDVVLFADLANPTSNAIYQAIGFVPVSDSLLVKFTAPQCRYRSVRRVP